MEHIDHENLALKEVYKRYCGSRSWTWGSFIIRVAQGGYLNSQINILYHLIHVSGGQWSLLSLKKECLTWVHSNLGMFSISLYTSLLVNHHIRIRLKDRAVIPIYLISACVLLDILKDEVVAGVKINTERQVSRANFWRLVLSLFLYPLLVSWPLVPDCMDVIAVFVRRKRKNWSFAWRFAVKLQIWFVTIDYSVSLPCAQAESSAALAKWESLRSCNAPRLPKFTVIYSEELRTFIAARHFTAERV